MTDSMKFGPEWLRNLSSEGTTSGGGGGTTISSTPLRCHLAEYRYGREEMLALFDKGLKAPSSLCAFSELYSEQSLPPLALVPHTDEERQWGARTAPIGPTRGRGVASPSERGGRMLSRGGGSSGGRGGTYQPYSGGSGGRGGYDGGSGGGSGGWGSGGGVDNWRRNAGRANDEDDGWRSGGGGRTGEKWTRSTSWREGDDERANSRWSEQRGGSHPRRIFDGDESMPEWATENLGEGGGTFDATGAFHGSDDEDARCLRRDNILQKSTSQQNITNKSSNHQPLSASKSAMSLSKPIEAQSSIPEKISEISKKEEKLKHINSGQQVNKITKESHANSKEPKQADNIKDEQPAEPPNDIEASSVPDEDYEQLQAVLKLVVDEEPTLSPQPSSNGIAPPVPTTILPPPPPQPLIQEQWYYKDPQGETQGPFQSTEMADWFRAGYFTHALLVRRLCDERFCSLGDLVALCNGANPFQSVVPIPPLLKQPVVVPTPQQQPVPPIVPPTVSTDPKMNDELLQLRLMQAQMAMSRPFGQGDLWNNSTFEFRQQMLAQQSPPTNPDMYLQQNKNHLMNMLHQMQMSKMQSSVLEKPLQTPLDPLQALVQQMSGIGRPQQLANMAPSPTPGSVKTSDPNIAAALHGLPVNGLQSPSPANMQSAGLAGMPNIPNVGGTPVLPNNLINLQKSAIAEKLEGVGDNMNYMHFLQKSPSEPMDGLWKRNLQQPQPQAPQTGIPPSWPANDKRINMWDMSTPPNMHTPPPELVQMTQSVPPQPQPQLGQDLAPVVSDNKKIEKMLIDANKEAQAAAEEKKKRIEAEEKQAKKEAEEKQKAEIKRKESEKKVAEEKKKKEEDRIRKELEKAKKEAEERRQKELAEKRRLKEQRKAEEEARRKQDELKKLETEEKERLAQIAREREEQRKQEQRVQNQKAAKAAPWSQPMNNQGLSLAEIQKLERERKAEQQAFLAQQQKLQMAQEHAIDKSGSKQLNWAKISAKPSQIKSLAEIQAEEQERLLKLKATEKAQMKEKEVNTPPTSGIWSGQSLTWTNNNDGSAGFWDEPPNVPVVQPKKVTNTAVKVANANKQNKAQNQQQPQQQQKAKNKRDEANSNNSVDEFSDWCMNTLATLNTDVDIPTFVTFLRDIESAMDVREYCRDYLGDKPATYQFATQFLEKRRQYRPQKGNVHKDDLCIPAPAINPSQPQHQHNNSNEFQEVKGKGKKCKKSKTFKNVDSRILGFSVTGAPDRINVGERDYGDNS